jgi:ribonucleoside-diphosphate reductase alpha chain
MSEEQPPKPSERVPEAITSQESNNVRTLSTGLLGSGLEIARYFSTLGKHPFDLIKWERRDVLIEDENGKVVFEQKGVEFPTTWSVSAGQIVAAKYFHGHGIRREDSLRTLIARVTDTITEWGVNLGYFASIASSEVFRHELVHLLLHQKMAFNSPVWFNVGIESKPQCSACFINGLDDNMDSILELVRTEGRLFKFGSGTGTNFSRLRSSREKLSGGGTSSGPVSFMRGFDSFAGAIKSGGKTRRAAKMVILDVDHPDIVDFIRCKAEEERKAWALIDLGYSGGFNEPGGAYDSVQFQNANHSVRLSDAFMRAVEKKGSWTTHARLDGSVRETLKAQDLLKDISEAAWTCGDPGIQFDTTINRWHTCPENGRINASNPCSEYMFLDDSACNLASLNLMSFEATSGGFDTLAFQQAIDITLLAQEILVDEAGYPTPAITHNSHDFRPLGLGYANLGALLMSQQLPYDSDAGRNLAAAITALMHGRANAMSAKIAASKGPFLGFSANRSAMLAVMEMHALAARTLVMGAGHEALLKAINAAWIDALDLGKRFGYRNAQVTVLAPTGTIAFMMDCDTTGVEPDIALVKYKRLVGGGQLKIVNRSVSEALRRLGYGKQKIKELLIWLELHGSFEGTPLLQPEHLAIFDCAFPVPGGSRFISAHGHLRMMAAVQPFLSGAISKTVNLPNEVTPPTIQELFIEAWKLGLKSVAVYRDGSKRTQPLTTTPHGSEARPARRRLEDEREAITHKFSIAGHEGYLTVGKYADGTAGELFIVMSKEGSVVSGLLDSFATAVSLALQYGVPLKVLVDKFSHSRYEPSGFTNNPQIRVAKSITDYIFRWLALKFLPEVDSVHSESDAEEEMLLAGTARPLNSVIPMEMDAPPCSECGSIMLRSGSCYRCSNCGGTSGCS